MKSNAEMYHLLVQRRWDEIIACLPRGEWQADTCITDPSLGTKFPLLVCAAQDGHVSAAKSLLELGANPNGRIIGAQTALMLACEARHGPIVEMLLNAGADVNLKWRQETPLMAAARGNRKDIATRLLTAGAQVTDRDGKGRSALSHATQADLIAFFVEQGCPVDGRDLHGPVMARDLDLVSLLLSKRPDVNARFDWPSPGGWIPKGATPLHLAANDTIPEMMIKCGAPLDSPKFADRLAIVELLLVAGADVNAQHLKSGWTPLLLAINSDQPEITAKLIEAGADPRREFECKVPRALLGKPQKTAPRTLSAVTLAQLRPDNERAGKLLRDAAP
jgi:ankyrin repeat protein